MSDIGGGELRFVISVDSQGIASIEDEVARPIEAGAKRGGKAVKGLEQDIAKTASAVSKQAQRLGKVMGAGLAQGIQSSSPQVQAALIRAVTAQQRAQSQAQQQQARAQQQAAAGAARLAAVQATAQGKQQASIAQSIAQQQVIATRVAGQQRVAITRAFLDTIGRAERALGAIVTGTASTIVSATRRIFAGTVGSIQRSFAERRSTITRELRIEQGLFANAAAVQQRANRGLVGLGLGAAGILGGGALAIGAIRQTFTLGSDFARGLNVLQAQLGLTDAQMKEVQKTAIALGNDINLPGVSAKDAADAINLLTKQFSQLGPAAIEASKAAAQGTLQLARATGATAEEAAQAVGVGVNVFTKDATKATEVADNLAFALSKAAGTSFQDFQQAFTQAAAVFASFQNPVVGGTAALKEFDAAIAILAKGGLVGSDAGTSLRNFFTQANRGTKESVNALKEVSDRAGVTGSAFFDAAGKGRTFTETLAILQRGLQGLSEEQRQSLIQTIFGTDAQRAANILIGEGAVAFQALADATGSQGFAAKIAAAQNKGLAGAIDAIKSQFQTFAILIFQKVNPILGKVGLQIASFIDKLANAGGVFAAVRAGLKGVALALGGLLAIKGLVEVLGLLRSFATFLGPLGVSAIVLGGALGFLLKRFGSFKGILDAVGRLIERVAPLVADLREQIFNFLAGLARRAEFLGRFSAFLQQIFFLLGQGDAAGAFDRLKVAVKALLQNLEPLGRAFLRIKEPIQDFLSGDFVGAAEGAKKVGENFINVLFATMRNVARRLDPVTTIIGDFVSRFKGQLIGAGIGAVAGGILGGPLGVAIGAALGVAVSNAIGKLRDIIGRIDVGALFGKFLNGVQEVGRRLGSFLSDERTLLAVAGVAAAAAAIAGRFVVGFISGILGHAGDIAAAFGKIFQAALTAPSIVKSVAALAILIRGVLTDQFKQANFTKILTDQINQGIAKAQVSASTASLADKLKAGFTTAGKVAGQALSIGIAAALSGSALGGASNNLEKGLGIAGLAGSAAAAFASFGGGPQGGIAAAATVGVGLLTAALSANAKRAAEARAAMQDYKVALDQAADSGKSTATAISEIFGKNVTAATDKQLQALKDLGINVQAFQDALAAGNGPAFIKGLKDELAGLLLVQSKAAQAGGGGLSRTQRDRVDDLRNALGFLEKQINAVDDANNRLDLENSLNAGASAADRFEQRVRGVSGAAGDLGKKTEEARKEAQRLFEEQRADKLKAELDAVKQRAIDIGTKADEANRKLIELLSPKAPAQTTQQASDTAAIATPGFASDVASGFEQGIDTALGGAQVRQGVNDFGSQVVGPLFATALKEGLKQGNPGAALSEALLNETVAINQLEVPQAAKDALLKALNDGFASASDPAVVPVGAEANQLDAQKAAAQIIADATAAAQAAGEVSIRSSSDAQAAFSAGTTMSATAKKAADEAGAIALKSEANKTSATSAGSTIHSTAAKAADKQITVGNKVVAAPGAGSSAGASIATNVGTGFKNGFSGMFASVQKTVQTVLNGAVTNTASVVFKISSPSKVFMGIGEKVMQGLVIGLRDGGADAVSAIEAIGAAMIDATKGVAQGVSSALGNIFKETFQQLAIGGGGNTGTAIAGFTTALRGVISQVASNAQELFAAAQKAPGERTLAERLLLGESFTSLRVGDEFGVANRAAIASAVDAIEAIGAAMIEQGFAAQDAANAMASYRAQLVLAATQAGLSTAEVEALVNSLGLSASGLAQFINQANQLNQIVAEGQRRVGARPDSLPTPTVNPTQQFITNNLYLPTGDPEANALAVVNRLALAVR